MKIIRHIVQNMIGILQSYSLSGSRTRLTRDHWDPIQKVILIHGYKSDLVIFKKTKLIFVFIIGYK